MRSSFAVVRGVVSCALLLAACGAEGATDDPAPPSDGAALALSDDRTIEFAPTTTIDPVAGEESEAKETDGGADGVLSGRSTITAEEAALLASMLESPSGRELLVDILSGDGTLAPDQAQCFVDQADPEAIAALASEETSVADLSVFDEVMAVCGIADDAFG